MLQDGKEGYHYPKPSVQLCADGTVRENCDDSTNTNEVLECEPPKIGVYPNCVLPPCPPGYQGQYPNCQKPAPPSCPPGKLHFYIH